MYHPRIVQLNILLIFLPQFGGIIYRKGYFDKIFGI